MKMRMRAVTLLASVALLGGVAYAAAGQTGAYFSQSVPGDIAGTVGSIHVSTTATSISFSNLLPGEPQTVTDSYTNTGSSPEDVYLSFNDVAALSALNNLGHYGAVTIGSTGAGGLGTDFYSTNLNDNLTSCGFFSNATSTQTENGETGPGMDCWPLTGQVQVASNLQPGAAGTFTFTFEYASYLSTQAPDSLVNGPWNTFPVAGQTYPGTDSGTGLPFQVVATQVGITPGQQGSLF